MLLAVFTLAACLWMAYFARAITFWSDDWAFIVFRREWDASALLSHHNGHLVAVHALVYKIFFEVFGLTSIWPYKGLVLGMHLVVVGLIYLYAARRVGSALAAVAAGLLRDPRRRSGGDGLAVPRRQPDGGRGRPRSAAVSRSRKPSRRHRRGGALPSSG